MSGSLAVNLDLMCRWRPGFVSSKILTLLLFLTLSMSQKRARSISSDLPSGIYKSSPIEDRSSKFIAFFSPTLTAKELQAHTDFKSASHRIAAWRKPSAQRALNAQRLLETGHDDDGEKYGGKALEKVLTEMEIEGAVVVARWYGGVMLGPVRFDHIKKSAREAVIEWSQEEERSAKKAKIRDDEAEKERLIATLPERDQSITVLRELLASKSQQSSSAPGGTNTPAKTPNYTTLPLATLQKLEHVRDATIGWIIKQIEKAEGTEDGEADAAMTPVKERYGASAQIDHNLTTEEDPNRADLGNQDVDTTPPKSDGI